MSKPKWRRQEPDDRRESILAAAIALSEKVGYMNILREDVAASAGVAPSLVSKYFGSIPKLKRDIMRAAVQQEVLSIVAQGVATCDPHALKASDDLKRRAAAALSSN